MNWLRSSLMLLALSALAVLGMAPSAFALQDGDTVRIIVPYSPGGGYDSQARLAAPFVEKALQAQGMPNLNVIVENVRGGGGAIATAMSYKAKADGTLICFWIRNHQSGNRHVVAHRSKSTSSASSPR